jgi:2-polyprenyl-3-methyl-5-hydroxy-6-metoxy-1,4-benzoquinol methylase
MHKIVSQNDRGWHDRWRDAAEPSAMKQVFDQVASRFTRSIDGSLQAGRYVRGELFVRIARRSISNGGRVLDFGCGPGRLSLLLAKAGYRMLGADSSEAMIAEARALDRGDLDVEFKSIATPAEVLTPATYDAIVCSSVIEYIARPDELLGGFSAALRDRGVLIISFANKSSLYRWYWDRTAPPNPMGAAQYHVWTWRQFRRLLERNGFAATTRPTYFEWPWDWRLWGSLLRRIPFVGSIGVVVAKPFARSRNA